MLPNEVPYSSLTTLPGPAEDGKLVLQGRVKDANAVRGIYQTLEWADQESAKNRTKVQAMADGYPPLAPAQQRMTGNAGACNVNWGRGAQILEEAKRPYPSLITNTETLCTLPIKFSFGTAEERVNWQPIMEEEWTKMLRSYRDDFPFFDYYVQLVHQRTTHGVGVVFWEDERDFRFKVAGLDTFKFPRHTKPFASAMTMVGCRQELRPDELWAKIRDPENATAEGWNVEECKKALMKAAPAAPTFYDWERWEEFWKNNDYMLSYGGAQPVVNTIFLWVKEVNGTVTHLAADYTNPDSGLLYKKEGRFCSMQDQFVIFPNGAGSNGTLHSVRGLGAVIYSMVLGDNRTYNKLQDLILLSATPLLNPPDEDSRLTAAIIPVGPINVLGAGWEYPERKLPDYQNSLYPLVEAMNQRMNMASAPYTRVAPTLQSRQPRTKYAEQVEQEVLSGLSEADITLFMNPWTQVMRNMVKRAIDPDYLNVDPGGHMAWKWIQRCVQRGVPLEAIRAIDVESVVAVSPLGGGSPQQRMMTFERLTPIIANADQTGQNWYNRQYTIAVSDVATADAIFPKTGPRTTTEDSIALLQNNDLVQMQEVPVLPDDDHTVHAQAVLARADQIIATIIPQGEMQPYQVADPLSSLYTHGMGHMEYLEAKNPDSKVTAMLRKQFQNLYGTVYNAQKELDDMMQEQAEQQAMNPEEGQPEVDFDGMAKLAETQAKIRIREEEHLQSMKERNQDMAIKDSMAAADIYRKDALALSKQNGSKP